MRCSKRFCTAPNVERCWLTASMAESISARSVFAADVSANTAELIEAPRLIVPTPTESESLAPTWKVIVTAAFRTLMPLNSALEPMRSISDASWLTSVWIALRSLSLSEPFLNWTASSRTRWSIEWTSSSEPSAVCTIEMPSWALRFAWSTPLICARMRSEIARPAASSAARLMR